MKLTTQEEYGLRCLLQLARDGGRSLTIPELSRQEGISAANVAKIMRVLRRAGFVRSTRGQSGGYALARPAEQIMVGEVLAAWAVASSTPGSASATRASSRLLHAHSATARSGRCLRHAAGRGRRGAGPLTLEQPAAQRARGGGLDGRPRPRAAGRVRHRRPPARLRPARRIRMRGDGGKAVEHPKRGGPAMIERRSAAIAPGLGVLHSGPVE